MGLLGQDQVPQINGLIQVYWQDLSGTTPRMFSLPTSVIALIGRVSTLLLGGYIVGNIAILCHASRTSQCCCRTRVPVPNCNQPNSLLSSSLLSTGFKWH